MCRASLVMGVVVLAGVAPLQASAQNESQSRIWVRAEAGTLNPDDPFNTTMAWGGSFGWIRSPRNVLTLRCVRQSKNRNSGEDLGANARTFLSLGLEHSFTSGGRYHNGLGARLAAGALFRPSLATAAALTGSLVLRYAVGRSIAFVGNLEDAVAALPMQDFQSCAYDFFGNLGGSLQHNFGFLVALEWRPGAMEAPSDMARSPAPK